MKNQTIMFLLILIVVLSCKNMTTEPTEVNLLINSTFELNGDSSLYGWIVSYPSVVQFSNDVPSYGSGRSIIFQSWGKSPPLSNSIFAMIPAPAGTHIYRLSIFGKKSGVVGGWVYIGRNLRSAATAEHYSSISVVDSVWTFYSKIDTLTTDVRDTLFVVITGGSSCTEWGSTHFNTCKFEKLN
ncbi:MAG: hypothetical protein QME58_03145 [Bacteroidota bacterium]|nr:hypothetical protein [Bacteroidota bacterium]